MAWLVLLLSGVLESVWAISLSKSDGFTKPIPTIIFLVALIASMVGLAYAVQHLPLGMSYAIWVGVGAGLTVTYSMATGLESASPIRIALLAGLVGCIIGLKIV